ncbi:MAG: hypothetical protein Q9160_008674 [Pyrenula sp. 1 TL-2023]
MKSCSIAFLVASAASTFAIPTSNSHAVHEKRAAHSWTKVDNAKPDGSIVLPIIEKFRPTGETIDAAHKWLESSGIDLVRTVLSPGRNWIKFNATISEMEELLHTKYEVYEHQLTGQPHLACDEYSLPEDVRPHIDLITPTVHFDVKLDPSYDARHKKRKISPGYPGDGFQPKKGRVIKGPGAPTPNAASPAANFSLATCNQFITPDCLRALYNIPNGTLDQSSYGIVEYTPQAYVASDLDLFYSNLQRQIPNGTYPTLASIQGGVVQDIVQGFEYNAYPQEVTLYQVGDLQEGASFNNFLDALDASYCTFEGGDDPVQDAQYPDPLPDGYKSQDCGTFTPASVISTSYGYNEADLPATYENRQCAEYMKLGLAGVSILYSSGDYGVAGNGGLCCTTAACARGAQSPSGRTFNPSFPGGCPYVTSVGATQIAPGASVTQPETACETVIFSGGGFSNVFPLPDYQSSAVTSFLSASAPPFTATQFNNSGLVRAFPDVSANGANYVVAVEGSLSLVYGTSASAPTFGAIVTLINNNRAAAGKAALGFLNPALYQNPEAFNDITTGGNQGCGTAGFQSVEGWDPVTGLGTPDFERLSAVLEALP